MPIITPEHLPINEALRAEGIHVIRHEDAIHQDIRPLRIALLNLMPEKQRTERYLARMLGHSPLQVHLTLVRTGTYTGRNESPAHLAAFYRTFADIASEKFDGFIVTGAPVEHLHWDEVRYMEELRSVFQWAAEHVYARLYICWGAQAALHALYGIEKFSLPKKAFGVFPHTVMPGISPHTHPLVQGWDDVVSVPVSRHTFIRPQDIAAQPDLSVIASSDLTGVYIAQSSDARDTYVFNHPEYGTNTLAREYERDLLKGSSQLPAQYFPDDDPSKPPVNCWRSHARTLYGNWLRMMYERTPYDIDHIGASMHHSSQPSLVP